MPAVRATIIAAIAKRKDIETLRTCLKFSADQSPSVQAAVAFAIGCNGKGKSQVHRQGLKILQVLSMDQSRLVRSYVKLAHEMMETA